MFHSDVVFLTVGENETATYVILRFCVLNVRQNNIVIGGIFFYPFVFRLLNGGAVGGFR